MSRGHDGPGGPVAESLVMDLRQSMRNGGGPACLRLRVVLDEAKLQAVSARAVLDAPDRAGSRLDGDALQPEHRLLAAALAWQALRCVRPWRPAFSDSDAERQLLDEAAELIGTFERH